MSSHCLDQALVAGSDGGNIAGESRARCPIDARLLLWLLKTRSLIASTTGGFVTSTRTAMASRTSSSNQRST